SYVLSDELSIYVWLSHFLNVDKHIRIRSEALNVSFQLIDTCTFFTDHNTWASCRDDDLNFLSRSLHFNFCYPRVLELLTKIVPEFEILVQLRCIEVSLSIPA